MITLSGNSQELASSDLTGDYIYEIEAFIKIIGTGVTQAIDFFVNNDETSGHYWGAYTQSTSAGGGTVSGHFASNTSAICEADAADYITVGILSMTVLDSKVFWQIRPVSMQRMLRNGGFYNDQVNTDITKFKFKHRDGVFFGAGSFMCIYRKLKTNV